jgi:fatty-acyl-CoA synthase
MVLFEGLPGPGSLKRTDDRGLTNNARLAFEVLGASAGEVCISAMPLFHTVGCGMGVLGTAQIGGSYVLVRAFEPGLMLELAERERANLMLGVPTMLIAMLEHPGIATRDLSALRVVASGGSLIAPKLVRAIEERTGARFVIQYGQTEASPVITMTSPSDDFEQRSTTLGLPLPHTEVKVVDPAIGATVSYGAVGELCARGYMVMSGYHEMPEATAAAIDAAGWLHTGDLATLDERGYCRIEGRLASYKCPRIWEIVEEFPLTASARSASTCCVSATRTPAKACTLADIPVTRRMQA